jgi:hypothetical protein
VCVYVSLVIESSRETDTSHHDKIQFSGMQLLRIDFPSILKLVDMDDLFPGAPPGPPRYLVLRGASGTCDGKTALQLVMIDIHVGRNPTCLACIAQPSVSSP